MSTARSKFESRLTDGVDWLDAFRNYSVDRCVEISRDGVAQGCPSDSSEAEVSAELVDAAEADVAAVLDEMMPLSEA